MLKSLVERFGKNWGVISRYMISRTGKQIRDRYLNSLDPTVIRGKFTYEEDQFIINYYKKYGSAWAKISKLLPGRTSDTIKNRFYTCLKKQTLKSGERKDKKESEQEIIKKQTQVINSKLEAVENLVDEINKTKNSSSEENSNSNIVASFSSTNSNELIPQCFNNTNNNTNNAKSNPEILSSSFKMLQPSAAQEIFNESISKKQNMIDNNSNKDDINSLIRNLVNNLNPFNFNNNQVRDCLNYQTLPYVNNMVRDFIFIFNFNFRCKNFSAT